MISYALSGYSVGRGIAPRPPRQPLADNATQDLSEWSGLTSEQIQAYRKANAINLAIYEALRRPSRAKYMREWLKAHPEKNRDRQHKRRVILKSLPYEKVDVSLLYEMHKGICGICNGRIPKGMATLDHIIPVAKGGGHVWKNMQIAHAFCNKSKGSRLQTKIYSI